MSPIASMLNIASEVSSELIAGACVAAGGIAWSLGSDWRKRRNSKREKARIEKEARIEKLEWRVRKVLLRRSRMDRKSDHHNSQRPQGTHVGSCWFDAASIEPVMCVEVSLKRDGNPFTMISAREPSVSMYHAAGGWLEDTSPRPIEPYDAEEAVERVIKGLGAERIAELLDMMEEEEGQP